ncbi:TonB-dependent receptor [Methylobacterium sp. Leaf125]|uniref:TonB-dependent receptor family protein n=1 Tax=Methylobacterium sp. Leaf125 TaxID=1736265 RepID=UPI0006FDED22|nr:TonB-dependent receptor [Methylobacterium sp. Leaf125]KQQ45545.1 TonB-dependent receptor [Methylobacterium sp. Leaf125]
MAAAPRSRRSQAVASRSAGSRTGAVRFACFVVLLAATDARPEDAAGIVLEELSVSAEGRPAPAAVPFGVSAPPGSSPSLIEQPLGATAARVGRTDTIENRPATSIGSVLLDSPGVTVRQGNGGRDVVISIRGNNARSTGVIRNMVVLEDGFLLTQPDGASRFDLVDPRAYSRIDVFRGPQSALFGNYATGGALAFRTRSGREIGGFEIGTDAGSFGYLSNSFTVGGVSGPVAISLFASDVRAGGYQDHSAYDTQTINLLASYTPTPDNRFTLKLINNQLQADLPARASLEQYRINPDQRGCARAATAAPGCTLTTLFANGAFGRTVGVTAAEGGFGRDDRRTVVALRWEHDLDAQTTWRTQLGFDERNFDQPFYTSAFRGSYPSLTFLTDLTRRYDLMGLPAVGYVAFTSEILDNHVTTFNRAPGAGRPALGALIGDLRGDQTNLGGRARTEVALSEHWTGLLGISATNTSITGRNIAYGYSDAGRTVSVVDAARSFLNVAPELALVYRPQDAWSFRGRVATGYATPTGSNLFVTSAGLPGNNTQLQAQENLGFDLGVDWTPVESLRISLTGFYEFFRNELLSQSPGGGRLSYFVNAPASEHRGVELGGEWAFAPGWRGTLAYSFDDQIYTRFTEQLSAGAFSARFDRAGQSIPGVPAHQLLARVGYDQVGGPLNGLGAFLETVVQDGVLIDNGNRLRIPGYAVLNANIHYATELSTGYAKRLSLYLEVRNLLDTTYIASALNLTSTLSRTTGLENGAATLAGTAGSILAGAPRNVVGGLKLSF